MIVLVFNEAQFYHSLCFPLLFRVSVRPEGERSMTGATGRELLGGSQLWCLASDSPSHPHKQAKQTQNEEHDMTAEFSNHEN